MKTVPLYGKVAAGRVALVDDEDFELVSRYRWHVLERIRAPGRKSAGPYARAGIYQPALKRNTMILMHILITGRRGMDHINGSGLDNRRENLRPAHQGLNSANARPIAGKSSRFKGVRLRGAGRWDARIRIDGRSVYLGWFADEVAAARAYDAAALTAWGEFARLNFPDQT